MKRLKITTGAQTEHYLDRYKREHRNINLPGNYIRIPAEAWVKFQEIRNRGLRRRQTLAEASREYEQTHN